MERRIVDDFCARMNWLNGHRGEVELFGDDDTIPRIVFSNEDGTRTHFIQWVENNSAYQVFGMEDY